MRKILSVLLLLPLYNYAQVTAGFNAPDSICINTPLTLTNTSAGASSYFWNFCVADLNTAPTVTNLGNIGSLLSGPVFMDYAFVNGKYYGFLANHTVGELVRLDFGNSLLNTPTATNLGNLGGLITSNYGTEGIQLVFNEGHWYLIVVNAYVPTAVPSQIIKVDLGTNITNTTPTATNWGNLGNMAQPIDLYVFKDTTSGNWYGFTTNAFNNTITRFNFTNSFNNTPTAVNMGNIGGLDYPTGIYAINDNGSWRVFIANQGIAGPSTLTRLDFGSSLLNTPTAVNLGTLNNTLNGPRDLTIIKSCGQILGFAVDAYPPYDLVKFDFQGNLTGIPVGVSLGNYGMFNFPHSISRLFRVNENLYGFITDVNTNSLIRLQFTGCTNANNPSSTLQNPAPITYNVPGTYNINLTVDDGLPTQDAYCRQVVVLPTPLHTPLQNFSLCQGDSIKTGTTVKNAAYVWNSGATTDSLFLKTTGTYWVQSTRYGCSDKDSFGLKLVQYPVVSLGNDTAFCSPGPDVLNAGNPGATYQWQDNSQNQTFTARNSGTYYVAVTNAVLCTRSDTIKIVVYPQPVITKSDDTTICHDTSIPLSAGGGLTYTWSPAGSLSNASISNPIASPAVGTTYYVTVTGANNCSNTDSIEVSVHLKPVFTITPNTIDDCLGTPVQLTATGGNVYSWNPTGQLDNPASATPIANPGGSITYYVQIVETTCHDTAVLGSYIDVLPIPDVTVQKANDIDCSLPFAQLNASGAEQYVWSPSFGLSDSTLASPIAKPTVTTLYTIKGIGANGCAGYDTLTVSVTKIGDLLFNVPNAFTPNGDGKNDCFGIGRYAALISSMELSIYNRWGVRVFHSTNPYDCWDGRYKGQPQDTGGFPYVIKATTLCGVIVKKGIVMLIR